MPFDFTLKLILSMVQNQLFDRALTEETINVANIDWAHLFEASCQLGVLPFVYSGISSNEQFKERINPKIVSNIWGNSLYQVVYGEKLMVAQNELVRSLDAEGIPYSILKGTSVSYCYPDPQLRILGDIDFFVAADDLPRTRDVAHRLGYLAEDDGTHIHEVLYRGDVRIEPHFHVADVPNNAAGDYLREIFRDALKSRELAKQGDSTFFVLAPEYQALALLLHMENHITKQGLDLRRLCDWAVFIDQRTNDVLWNELIKPKLQKCGLEKFAQIITMTCVKYLGLNPICCTWISMSQVDEAMCDDILEIIVKSCSHDRSNMQMALSFSLDKENRANQGTMHSTIIANLGLTVKRDYPFVIKYPVLYPVLWLISLVRNTLKLISSPQENKSVFSSLQSAMQIKRIYRTLRIFEGS